MRIGPRLGRHEVVMVDVMSATGSAADRPLWASSFGKATGTLSEWFQGLMKRRY